MKNISVFLSEKFRLLEVKFSIYLNRRVFVMGYFLQKKNKSKCRLLIFFTQHAKPEVLMPAL